MRYCQHCGTQIIDNAKYCLNCGKPIGSGLVSDKQDLIDKLSSRLKTNGIIWAAIAIIQIIMGLYGNWNLLIIGALNVASAVINFKNGKQILSNQNGIIQTYEPIVWPIITLTYNLFVGGVIGILGSVYYLIFVRGFIMENKSRFLAMETPSQNQYNSVQNPNIINTSIVLTEKEACNGTEKEIYIAEVQKSLKVHVPKHIKEGQTLVLHNVKGTNKSGETVKKDIYIKINIRHNSST